MKFLRNKINIIIVFIYFITSCLYFTFYDKLVSSFFSSNSTNSLLITLQNYQGVLFIVISSIFMYVALKRKDYKTKQKLIGLRKYKNRHYDLFDNITHGVLYVSPKGIVLSVNQTCLDILGVEKEHMVGHSIYKPSWKPVHENKSPVKADEHPTKIAFKTKKPVLKKTIGIVNAKTGVYTWLKVNAIPEFENGKKQPFRACIIIDDITELKNNQDLLIKNQKSIREASQLAKIGFWEFDTTTNKVTWSDYLYEIFGLDPKNDPPPQEEIIKYFDKPSLEKLQKSNVELIANGTPYDIDVKIINLNNEEIWARNVVHPIYNKEKEIIGRRGIVRNITDDKKAQLKLEQSKQSLETSLNLVEESEYALKEAGRIAKIGYWSYDEQTDVLFWSEGLHKIYGTDPKKGVPPLDEILNFFTEDSRLTLIIATTNLAKNGVPYEIELNLTDTNNKNVWIKNTGQPIFNDKNEVIGRRGVSQDITESKNIQLQLLKEKEKTEISEAKFKSYTEKSPTAIYTTNLDGDCTYANETWLEISGMTLQQASGTGWVNALHPDDLEAIKKDWYQSVQSNGKWKYEYRFINIKTKEITWVEGTAKEIFNDKNELIGYLGTNVNITERKKAEEMYRLLADNTNDLISLQDPETNFTYLSPSIKTLLGYEAKELIGKQNLDLVHEEDVATVKHKIEQSLNGLAVNDFIFRIKHKKGHYVWLESLLSTVYQNNNIIAYLTSSRDITQWMLARKKIEEYQTSLQKLTAEVAMIEEKQKKDIAANIHDHLSQSLVISKMRISELQKNASLKNISEDLDFVNKHISEALENSRKITYELSPPVLYQLGLLETLEWMSDDIQEKYDITVHFTSNTTHLELSEFKSILIYRCVQEVITNIIKYAKATEIKLQLNKNEETITIIVKDNGVGFDTAILKNTMSTEGGFGLFAVRERIRNLNGELQITSEKNVGTTVKFFVHLNNKNDIKEQ
ncbi:PAS domain S-box protein [Polaribacter aestuariivivens]|uniref:PAS domain-containing sensor histidine kinase n=1 Tax=Polaribacter aestuariivivens TaxID=2304626 RepID=UPI003F497FED